MTSLIFSQLMKLLLFTFGCVLCFSACRKTDKLESNYTYQIATCKKSYLSVLEILSEDYKNESELLADHVNGFASLPILPRFENAKSAWISTKSAFFRLTPFLYADHLKGTKMDEFIFQNYSGFNPTFVDSTEDSPNAGIIKDESNHPDLDYGALILIQNATSNPNDRIFGFKPIEFMLFGEDKSFTQPGSRTHYEFSNAEHGVRRRDLLRGMVTHLDVQTAKLNLAEDNQTFQRMPTDAAFESLVNGLIDFIQKEIVETGLNEPLAQVSNQNQIFEVSLFADASTTHLLNMIEGVEAFLDGRAYHKINSSYYLVDLMKEVDESFYNRTISSLDESKKVLNGLGVDFDKALNDPTYHDKIERVAARMTDLIVTLEEFKTKVLQ